MIELADATWTEVRDLDRERCVAVLPIGATEAHGPHLPLATDVIIARAMAVAGARRLSAAGLTPVVLPAVAFSPAGFAASFPGTISISLATMAGLIVDIATSLHRAGIGTLAIANAHFDPDNLEAIRTAGAALAERGLVDVVFPDVTGLPWAGRLTDEFKSGACHAGRYEGSVVLAAAPGLVRDDARRDLASNPVSLSKAIREGKTSFHEAGGPLAYFGAPAEATAGEGEHTIEVLGGILADAVLEAVEQPVAGE